MADDAVEEAHFERVLVIGAHPDDAEQLGFRDGAKLVLAHDPRT